MELLQDVPLIVGDDEVAQAQALAAAAPGTLVELRHVAKL